MRLALIVDKNRAYFVTNNHSKLVLIDRLSKKWVSNSDVLLFQENYHRQEIDDNESSEGTAIGNNGTNFREDYSKRQRDQRDDKVEEHQVPSAHLFAFVEEVE